MARFAAVLLLSALLVVPSAALAQQPAPSASYTYTGTVHAVQPTGVQLLTGVGHAVRVLSIMVAPEARVALRDLRAGDVVRAECRQTEAGLVADRIEKLGRAS